MPTTRHGTSPAARLTAEAMPHSPTASFVSPPPSPHPVPKHDMHPRASTPEAPRGARARALTPRRPRSARSSAGPCHWTRPVPSSRFRTSSTASSARRVAGLLHPASGPGVRVVSCVAGPIRRPEHRWHSPTRGFTPPEGHHPPAAAPRRRGRCLPAVHPTPRAPSSFASPLSRPSVRSRLRRGPFPGHLLTVRVCTRIDSKALLRELERCRGSAVTHAESVLSSLAGPLRPRAVADCRTPYPSMGFVPFRGLHQRTTRVAPHQSPGAFPWRFRARNRRALACREDQERSFTSSRVPTSGRPAARYPSQALGSLLPVSREERSKAFIATVESVRGLVGSSRRTDQAEAGSDAAVPPP